MQTKRPGGKYLIVGNLSEREACLFKKGEGGVFIPKQKEFQAARLILYKRQLQEKINSAKSALLPVAVDGKQVYYGEPLAAGATVEEVVQALTHLEREIWEKNKQDAGPIYLRWIKTLRKNFGTLALADREKKLSHFKMFTAAIALARTLREPFIKEKNIAILIPVTIGSVVSNLALALMGKVVVNLNFTAGKAAIESALKQAGITKVITSRAFLDKIKIDVPDGVTPYYLEDLVGKYSLKSAFLARFAPISWIERFCGQTKRPTANDLLTIIFTSGSAGEPKGVQLTHGNLISNVDSISNVIPPIYGEKNLLATLPLFHSFGYMQMWLGAMHRWGLIVHPSPLEAKPIGELVKKYRIKLMMTTPSFLRAYIKQVEPTDFQSLEIVIAGAEKLSARIQDAFSVRFGVRPVEGYGTTECAPVVSVNDLTLKSGTIPYSAKDGSVGRPVPALEVKIVHPDTGKKLALNEQGLVLVKGPNVMQGYLHRQDLTDKVLIEGWYNTGDIGYLDEDGYLTLVDRLRRISKIGGEMVAHAVLEEALHHAIESDERCFVVTAVPCEKKGERLVVLHTINESVISSLLDKCKDMGLSNLYMPRQDDFVKVLQLPLLGSGKIDLQKVQATALECRG